MNLATGDAGTRFGSRGWTWWVVVAALSILAAVIAVRQFLAGSPASPSPEIRAAIDLVVSEASVRPARGPVGVLPSMAGPFVNRKSEIAAIVDTTRRCEEQGAVVVGIYGKPGVGKSGLARRVVSRLAGQYPDGRIFLTVGALMKPDDVTTSLLLTFGEDVGRHSGPGERLRALQAALSASRIIVVFDDVHEERQVRDALPAGRGSAALITSRRPMSGLGLDALHGLDVLSTPDGIELLREVSARPEDEHDPSWRRIVELCGQLPIALHVAASLLRIRPRWSVENLATALADERRRLDLLRVGDADVRASFGISYNELRQPQQALFRRLGLLGPNLLDASLAAAVAGVPPDDALVMLEELVDAQLLEATGFHEYRFHDLIRLYAYERTLADDSDVAREAALSRAFEVLLAQATDHGARLDPSLAHDRLPVLDGIPALGSPAADSAHSSRSPARPTESFTWFGLHADLVLFLASDTTVARSASSAAVLTLAVTPYLLAVGRLEDALALTTSGAAHVAGMDGATTAAVEAMQGATLHRAGRNGEAIALLEHAMPILRATGQQRRAVRTARRLAQAYREAGDLRQAVPWYGVAFSGFVAEGSLVSAAGVSSDLAQVYKHQGDFDKAAEMMTRCVRYASQSLEPAEGQDPDVIARSTVAWAQENLGAVRKRQYRTQEAIASHTASLEQFQHLGDTVGQGFAIRNLGDLAATQGSLVDALRLYEISAQRFQRSGASLGEAQALASIATTQARLLRLRAAGTALLGAARASNLPFAVAFAAKVGAYQIAAARRGHSQRPALPGP
ncbi:MULTISPECIES: tetratricopeptide repeat protein [unclassified Micromonospora]|uniref:tetratricopeptide repeat protein n=1 Tax=unclassified Micromonospora TaxID=2617518 RepID=UPI002FF21AA0